jgi:hypothetical protein
MRITQDKKVKKESGRVTEVTKRTNKKKPVKPGPKIVLAKNIKAFKNNYAKGTLKKDLPEDVAELCKRLGYFE